MQSYVNEISASLCEVKPFELFVNYAELYPSSPENIHESHFHERCEIYINLSGDVSYMVENHLYPVHKGDIFITNPFEYHNCIYNSDILHKQYVISFDTYGNERLFEVFLGRRNGEGNPIRLSNDRLDEIIECCNIFLTKELSSMEKYAVFTRILFILSTSISANQPDMMPEIVKCAVDYITLNISEHITIKTLAEVSHVSVNTLELHFKEALGMSPSCYIKNKRLANAARMLRKGASVTDACFDSGYVNVSHFIVQFKKHFGVTPNKYRSTSR